MHQVSCLTLFQPLVTKPVLNAPEPLVTKPIKNSPVNKPVIKSVFHNSQCLVRLTKVCTVLYSLYKVLKFLKLTISSTVLTAMDYSLGDPQQLTHNKQAPYT